MKIKLRVTQHFSFYCYVLVFFLSYQSVSQPITDPAPITWGDIKKSDFSLMDLPEYDDDAIVTLCNFGQAYMDDGSYNEKLFRRDYHKRFLIVNPEGIKRANIKIYYSTEDYNEVKNIKGAVYNLDDDGNIIVSQLENDQVFKVDYSDLDDFGIMTFSLPNVKTGSIVEISYSKINQYIPFSVWWEFQSNDPCLYSEYRFATPDNYAFAVIRSGLLYDSIKMSPSSISATHLYNQHEKVYKYVLKNIPPVPDEPYVSSMGNFRTRVIFQVNQYYNILKNVNIKVITSWKELAEELKYSSNFGSQINRGLFYSKFDSLYSNGTDIEKVENCFNFVNQHFTLAYKSVNSDATNIKEAYQSGKGSVSEINLFLAGLLKKAGLKPRMALVSTRDNGHINEMYPFLAQFNHAICVLELNGKLFFLDASSKSAGFLFPPPNIVGCKAFIVDPKNPEFININTSGIYNEFVMCTGSIAGDSLVGKLQFKYKGYAAANERENYIEDGEDYYRLSISEKDNIILSNEIALNKKKSSKPFLLQVDYAVALDKTEYDDLLYINPFEVYGDFENPFKSDSRDFPIDFNYPIKETYMYSINIPENYEILEIPENVNTMLADSSVSVLVYYQVNGNNIQIKTNLSIERVEYQSSEYENLKSIFDLWEIKHDEMILFKLKD